MKHSVQDLATLFKALADPIRLRILALIAEGEVCVCHMHESLQLPQPTVSRHLAYLRRSGLVEARRDGLWMHYRLATLADPVVAAIGDTVRHALAHMDIVQRDAERLQKKTGGCVPAPRHVAGLPCCSEPLAAGHV